MQTHKPKTASINDFREWNDRGELVLSPEFQRRKVWSEKARSYLVDTILKGFPIPGVYLRQKIHLKTQKTIREVVDGQQRIRAVLDYIKGNFAVSKVHNKKYGGLTFSELPDETKEKYLEYDLSVDLLVGADDLDILEVFARINSYTVILNTQEKLNAEFSGKFKQAVFTLGRDHLEFWRKNKILTNYNIMRMKEAELSTDLVIAMINGIQDRSKIKSYYIKYDDEFPQEDKIVKHFRKCIDTIAEIFEDTLIESPFRRSTLFYSLFCAIYDILYGLPNSDTPNYQIKRGTYEPIKNALSKLEKELTTKEPSPKYFEFKDASTRHTTDQSRRLIRHRTIINEILKELNIS
ncbi:hypothetical protein ES705_34110 [subsurface metagenome]